MKNKKIKFMIAIFVVALMTGFSIWTDFKNSLKDGKIIGHTTFDEVSYHEQSLLPYKATYKQVLLDTGEIVSVIDNGCKRKIGERVKISTYLSSAYLIY